ncbi:hypothetical protein J009_06190 [Cryptococcus neoformans]|nr:hypothetical protein J009_06190 [Cryptococcus neoformans var. grubii]OXH43705.1 hypothetical protein J004_06200 [Cryptococcus neoformans var. grubii]
MLYGLDKKFSKSLRDSYDGKGH